jgi:hypothetical protein
MDSLPDPEMSQPEISRASSMRYPSIRQHLRPYKIVASRKTTINHAFAAAISPHDDYDEARLREAIAVLGQDPDNHLFCVYCGGLAQTWDHVFATVKASKFSGFGHRLGNLLPCCKPCNSAKGNKHWNLYLKEVNLPDATYETAVQCIGLYLGQYAVQDSLPVASPEYEQLQEIRLEVLVLLAEADRVAEVIREKATPI